MRYWIYAEPASEHCMEPVWTIISDTAIIAQYWKYWRDKMVSVGLEKLLNEENCVMDWVSVHWATEANPETLMRIISAPNPENSEAE